MSEHTPGRLVVLGSYSIYTADDKTPVADTCLTNSVPDNDEANARRLVACWNALEDLPQAALDGGWTRDGLEAYGLQMKAERDSLRAVNAELLAFANEWLERQGTDNNYMTEKARAAIASARKQGEQG